MSQKQPRIDSIIDRMSRCKISGQASKKVYIKASVDLIEDKLKNCALTQPQGTLSDASEADDRQDTGTQSENSQVDPYVKLDPPKAPTIDALLNVTDNTGALEPTSRNPGL